MANGRLVLLACLLLAAAACLQLAVAQTSKQQQTGQAKAVDPAHRKYKPHPAPSPPPGPTPISPYINGTYRPVPCRGKNAVANSYTCYKISVNFHITYYNATLQSHTFVGEMYDSRSNFTTKVGIASGLITHTGPQPDNSTHVYSYDGIAFAFGGELNIIYVNLLDNNKNLGEFNRGIVGGTGQFLGATGAYNRVAAADGVVTSIFHVYVPSLPHLD